MDTEKEIEKKVKKDFFIQLLKDKNLAKTFRLCLLELSIFIILLITNLISGNCIIYIISGIFVFQFILINIFNLNIEKKAKKEKLVFQKKIRNYEKELDELQIIYKSIIIRQENNSFEGFEEILYKYQNQIINIEKKIIILKMKSSFLDF